MARGGRGKKKFPSYRAWNRISVALIEIRKRSSKDESQHGILMNTLGSRPQKRSCRSTSVESGRGGQVDCRNAGVGRAFELTSEACGGGVLVDVSPGAVNMVLTGPGKMACSWGQVHGCMLESDCS